METQKEFAQTLQDAILYFSSPDVCVEFLAKMRWENGVTCPYCANQKVSFIKTRRIWQCLTCKKQFSVKVGTIFEDSAIPLQKWLPALWMVVNDKNGISSYEAARALGVTQKTAWFMNHRIRLALQDRNSEKLDGEIEVDETWVGGKFQNMHKAKRPSKADGQTNKTIVVGMLQRGGKVRATVIKDTSRHTLQKQVRSNVDKTANLYTDAHPAYDGLVRDYHHEMIDHRVSYGQGSVHTNGIENFWSLLKRSVKGTYVHVDNEHVERYLDEQSFRFNNRKVNDSKRFTNALKSVSGRRLTYRELVGKD